MIHTIKGKVTLAGRATSWRVRVAPPGRHRHSCRETVARAGGTARAELDRPIVPVLAVHNDGGVLRYQT